MAQDPFLSVLGAPPNRYWQKQGAAVRRAQEASHLEPQDFYAALRDRLGRSLPSLALICSGECNFGADLLLAAAELASEPVSALLGESELYEYDLAEMEFQLHQLSRS